MITGRAGHAPTVEPQRPRTPCTVLLVDDRDDIRRLLTMLLEDEPDFVVVAEAANGREAIELAQRHRPDLVVLDNDMPVMTGLEALPHIVESAAAQVVLFSADADDYRDRAIELGAAEAIPKSTGVMSFVDQLRAVRRATADCAESEPPSRS